MSFTPALRILIVAAVSILALVGLVVGESLARQSGTEVLLRMEAVDPRAILSGHYVDIALRENQPEGAACPVGATDAETASPTGARGHWIALRRSGALASAAAMTARREDAARASPLVVRGEALCRPSIRAVDLDLGVKRFHVSQAEAERIDKLLANRRFGHESPVAAIVSIGQDGRARLNGLMVQGRRIDLALF
ncbi:MAG TPA: GDYXXLXY domain-containing protein [Caulobacteraceae bacterium]|nr:GDYXXLXY domain-containing protein [Caulobacteraceae bacterium]